MRYVYAIAAAALAAFTLSASAAVSTDPRQAPTGVYQLDSRHAQVQFAITHFGISDFFGRFEKASGTLNFNAADPARSSVSVTIDTTSLSTQNSALTQELAAPSIFDAARSPAATFKSTAVTRTGPSTGKITGDLTIKGITKPVTLDVTYNGSTVSPMAAKATLIGFHATATIKRSDYSMTGVIWSSIVSDEVKLDIEAPFAISKE
jgi:polyisoprenoid-binding protein YceI